MSKKAEQIYDLIKPIEELISRVLDLSTINNLNTSTQSQIREAEESLNIVRSKLLLGAEKQAAYDFIREMKDKK